MKERKPENTEDERIANLYFILNKPQLGTCKNCQHEILQEDGNDKHCGYCINRKE